MFRNRICQAYQEGRPSFGTYITTPSPRVVELLGSAGLDFVRIDMDGAEINLETVQNMIYAAHTIGTTPIVRVPSSADPQNNAWIIQAVLNMGAMGVIVPRVSCRQDVEAAVQAAKPPPLGQRHAGPNHICGGFGQLSAGQYAEWVNENVILAVQAETRDAIENIEELLSVPGLDMVHSGRADLSYEYGVPGQQYHPLVLEAERKVIEAGLKAGKIVTVQYYPLRDPSQVETVQEWIRIGVHCLSLGSDKDIIHVFRRLIKELVGPQPSG